MPSREKFAIFFLTEHRRSLCGPAQWTSTFACSEPAHETRIAMLVLSRVDGSSTSVEPSVYLRTKRAWMVLSLCKGTKKCSTV